MQLTDSRASYVEHVARLKLRLGNEAAVRIAIGGEFVAMGTLEHELLRSLGLRDGDRVVDVGCGSGRLAYQLARYEHLHYHGFDVVPDLVDHAARISRRPDWCFRVSDGDTIPLASATADFVCFFSVFTHLLHEQSFRYLQEAARVLRPGGRIVFSFLEFRIPCHWEQFQLGADHNNAGQHLNQFIERSAIQAWAERLGLTVEQFADGDRPHIPLSRDVQFESGRIMRDRGNLGQSVAVLRVPPQMDPLPGKFAPERRVSTQRRARGLSARGFVGVGDAVFIVGFEIAECAPQVLIRAIGPGLVHRGVSNPLQRPQVQLHDASGRMLQETAEVDIFTETARREIAGATAAAELPAAGFGDAVLYVTLQPGAYTVVVRGHHGAVGNVLTEVYTFDAAQ